MNSSFGSPWANPWDTPGEPMGNGTVLHFFLPRGGGELSSFGNDFAEPMGLFEFWSAVHRSGPKVFSRAILFHFDAKFWYYVMGVHNSPREGLFVINFMPLYPGALDGFCWSRKTIPSGYPAGRPHYFQNIWNSPSYIPFSHIFMASRLHSHAKPAVMEILDKHSTKG